MPDPYSPLYGQGEDLLQRAAQSARNGAEKVASAIRPGMPSSVPLEVPPDTGILRGLANGTRAVGSGITTAARVGLRAAPGVNGFLDGSNVLDSPATPNAVGNNNQPGTDVPTDLSPERKAQMMTPSTYNQPPPAGPLVSYMKQSRDGILSGIHNASVENVRQTLMALPGGGAVGLIGGLAQGGSRLAKVGALAAEGMMADRAGYGVGKGLVDTGFIQPPAPGPLATAAAKASGVAAIAPPAKPTATAGDNASGVPATPLDQHVAKVITQMNGGQFASPMFTDDPTRALQQAKLPNTPDPRAALDGYVPPRISSTITGADGQPQTYYPPAAQPGQTYGPLTQRALGDPGDRINVTPSTAASDRKFLSAAFNQHIASGDIARAAGTLDPNDPTQQAAYGNLLRQHQQEQAQAAQEDPIRRMMMEAAERSLKPKSSIYDHAFGGSMRGRGGAAPGGGDPSQGVLAQLSQAMAAQKAGQVPQGSPMAQAIAQTGAQAAQQQTAEASKTNIEGQKIAQQGQKITQDNQLQLRALQTAIATETDPTKLASLVQKWQVLNNKYEKPDPASKLVLIDVDSGEKDIMGKPIMMKAAFDPETKQTYGGPKPKQRTREEITAQAKNALAAGAKKEAINATSMQLYGFEPL